MSKKVSSYFLFILIAAVLFSSSVQPSLQNISKAKKFHSTYTINKTHLLDGIKSIDCINETEEDFDEDKFPTPQQSSFYLIYCFFNIRIHKLHLSLPQHFNFNKNLYSNVPINIAIGIFRI